MVNIIVQLSKYLMILMITVYTYLCFSIFGYYDPDKKKRCLRKQNVLMFVMHLTAFLVMYLEKKDTKILALYLMQVTLLGGTILLYSFIYPKVSRLVVNNMCMLLSIGFIMITRLNYDKAAKQYLIAAAGIVLCLVIPIIIRKVRFLSEWRILYGIVGIVSLAVVVVVGRVSYGAMLGFTVAGINIQPSELVKIVFVFFVASSFKRSTEFKDLVVTTVVAAFHVLILVVSKDLGAALIIFVVYLVMLYVATHQPLYILAGLGAGSLGAVAAYHLFTHVKTRVNVWRDPFGTYDNGGYQVAQSLFAIGTGGWFGAGLYQGQPDTIPVSAEDFIFSAISEEMGLIYAIAPLKIVYRMYRKRDGFRVNYEKFMEILNELSEKDDICIIKGDKMIWKAVLQDNLYEKIEEFQGDRDFYIPTVEETLDYAKHGYPSQDVSYRKLASFLRDELHISEEKIEELLYIVYKEFSMDGMLSDIMEEFKKRDIVFDSDRQMERFAPIMMEVNNNTRMLDFRGYTPNEVSRAEQAAAPAPVAPAMPSFVPMANTPAVNMQPKKKVYPNDPCPCGSGKKYKKCCGRN